MTRNKFGIPEELLAGLRERDRDCVYCGKAMVYPYERVRIMECATIEHLNRDGPFYWDEGLEIDDLVMCCSPCNSSRGRKLLHEWFLSPYCTSRGITAKTVAEPVRVYLARMANEQETESCKSARVAGASVKPRA